MNSHAGKPDYPSHSTGFTLIEMIVVMVIGAMLVAVVLPRLPGSIKPAETRSAAHELLGSLRQTRSLAILGSREMVFELDLQNRSFRILGKGKTTDLPHHLQLTFTAAQVEQQNEHVAAIRFFSDGSSTGGQIVIGATNGGFSIDTDWLTGYSRLSVVDARGEQT